MKRPFFPVFLVVCFSFFNGFSQVGIGTATPNPKAVLELRSPGNNQGFLVPRLTTAQRIGMTGLSTPEKGLLVFDNDLNKFHYWNGTDWIAIEDNTGTDNQTLSFDAATGLLSIAGENNVTVSGTAPGGSAGGDLTGIYPNPTVGNNTINSSKLQSDATVDANRAVTTNHIRDNAITSSKVVDGTLSNNDINASAGITVNKFAAGTNGQVLTTVGGVPTWNTPSSGGSVTNVATGTGLTGGPITTTGTISIAANGVTATELRSDPSVDANRSVNTNHLRDNSVTSAKIADGAILGIDLGDAIISTTKLVDGAVNSLKLGDAAVTTLKLADNSVTSLKLGDNAVTTVKLADNAVSSLKLGDNAVTTLKIANDAVTSTKILDGTLATADLADAAVTTAKVVDGAITSTKVLDGTLATADLADAAVTTAKVVDGAITSTKVLDGTLATADLADAAVTTAKVVDGAITSAKVLNGTLATADLADGSITSAKILDGTIATGDIAAAAITDAKLATGIDIAKLSAAPLNGLVLTTVLGNVTWAALPVFGAGTVTSVATTGGLTGGPITTTGTLSIADGGVITIKVADDAITSAKLQDDAGTDANRAVTTNHIRDNAIISSKITDGTIATADLADAAVTSIKISDGSIANADVSATAAVAVSKLAAGSNTQVLTTVLGVPTWQAPVDGSTTNEIQSLSITGSTLSISGGNSVSLPTSGSQDLGSVLATGGDAKNGEAYNLKSVSINLSSPGQGALNVNGSQYVSFTPVKDIYDVKPDDYLLFGIDGQPTDIALPKASDNRGRILIIRAMGNTAGERTVVTSTEGIDGSSSSEALYFVQDNPYSITVVSTGTTWLTINRAITPAGK